MASRFSVEAIFKAVDRISNPLRKMGLNSKKFSRKIKTDFAKAQRAVKRFTQNAKRNMKNVFKIGVVGAIGAAGFALRSFIGEAAKIEDAVAGFTPLLGSVDRANELVEKLNQTAASTPFQFDNIAAAAKQLLPVMNQDIEKTIATFRMLGDTAGGDAQKLESITRGFTKSLLKGKVDLESLNMIAEAGVPIFDQLSKELGVTTQDMFKMVTAGEVTTDSLTDTFRTMTSEGGLFFNGMQIASETFSGRMSTLKDNLKLTAASIGSALLPMVKRFVDKGIEVAAAIRAWADENKDLIKKGFEKFLKVGKKVFEVIGKIVKVIIDIVKFLKPILPVILGVVAAFVAYTTALRIAAAVQALFNLIMAANPLGLIVIAIAAVIAIILLLIDNWEAVKEVVVRVWDTIVGAIQSAVQAVSDFVMGLVQGIIDAFNGIVDFIGNVIGGVKKFLGIKTEINSTQTTIAAAGQNSQGQTGIRGVDSQNSRSISSISETTNRTEVVVTNNGTSEVQTDSGTIPPGGTVVLPVSG